MLFNSHVFLFLFLPLVLLFWQVVRDRKIRIVGLTLASYIFYGYWEWRFTPLMLLATGVNYCAGAGIASARNESARKRWLAVGVSLSLLLLGVFKYTDFVLQSVSDVIEALSLGPSIRLPGIVLPIGISFFTFQAMSYTIDVYRGDARPAEDFWTFAAYVAMFPQLIAGPIVRYTEVDNALRTDLGPLRAQRLIEAVHFFSIGLAKKMLVADPLARQVDPLLTSVGSFEFSTAWLAMLGYTLQIYFDFSAYSDMAVGLGRLLGFSFPQNFNSPYKSTTIAAFWRRWHMTLSFWLRDYLYISLGGNRQGTMRTLVNLGITMFLGGLWHGAAWTFVLWGLYHGLLLILHQTWTNAAILRIPDGLSRAITFVAVVFGWVLFRAPDLASAGSIYSAMIGLQGFSVAALIDHSRLAAMVLAGLGIVHFMRNSWEMPVSRTKRWGIAYALLFGASVLLLTKESPFLYFQF